MIFKQEYHGLKYLEDLKNLYDGKKILIVTGKKSFEISGAKEVCDRVLAAQDTRFFSDFAVNPKISDAMTGAIFAREENIEVILAIGGGSVMDMAKLIKAFYNAEDNEQDLVVGKRKVADPNIPIIAIPTTAGSGSEATHFAVVYIGSDKYSLASEFLLPEAVILDGSLTLSGGQYLKTCNALDAMAQAIESFWAAGSTDQSRKFALSALELGWQVLPRYISDNCSEQDAQKMLEAANLAGQAINISKTTAAHAWSYAFTSYYNIPHGHAVWLTLPKIFAIHAAADDKAITDQRGTTHLRDIMNILIDTLSLSKNTPFDEQLCTFLNDINIEHQMAKLGLADQNKRKNLSLEVNMERMGNNPVNLNRYISDIFDLQ